LPDLGATAQKKNAFESLFRRNVKANITSAKTVPNLKVEGVKTKLSCEASLSESGRCENEALVRDFPSKTES